VRPSSAAGPAIIGRRAGREVPPPPRQPGDRPS